MRQQDALSADRRRLPMVEIDKAYVFESPDSKVSLCDLFDGRRQLIVYHFMFDPNDPPPGKHGNPWEEGCPRCSFVADQIPHLSHLHARDTSFVLVSRAPQAKIKPFKARMGWTIPWYSSFGSDFNYDFHVTIDEAVAPVEYNYKDKATLEREHQSYKAEQPGLSAFLRVGDRFFHTYSAFARGLEPLLTTYHLIDLTAYGRQEKWEDSPEGWPKIAMEGDKDWVRHHDKYGQAIDGSSSCCPSWGDPVARSF
jgi:predicted dithiol-disulfide oxidoreductase (DUF899 family)